MDTTKRGLSAIMKQVEVEGGGGVGVLRVI